MPSIVTIGFSSHRIEVIPFAKRLMNDHEVIIIEEAPNPQFQKMLRGTISVNEYLHEGDMEFPEFSLRMYRLLKGLHRKGKKILQIEPYMERLMNIYEMFYAGKKPSDVLKIPGLRKVYEAEKRATAALIHFYASSMGKSFPGVVEAVKSFARADAERFRLRDTLRAEAIAKTQYEHTKVFIEAGAIHGYLEKVLKEKLGKRCKIRSAYLLSPVVKKLTGKEQVIPPGDLLTSLYIFHKETDEDYQTLQAARSLIYIKILEKEEMIPTPSEKTPHTKDEIRATELSSRFTLEQCRELYEKIRFLNRTEALEVVQDYVNRSRG